MSQQDAREQAVKQHVEELKDDAKANSEHIRYESFGEDKNKKKKNSKGCDRGNSSGAARYCSKPLRGIYSTYIFGDNEQSEFCVISRHNKSCCVNSNGCSLCHIDENAYDETPFINLAKALCIHLGAAPNCDDERKCQSQLNSFMVYHLGTDYPALQDGRRQNKNEHTELRIFVNGQPWIAYYIKLTAFTSMLKTSAPSGYKYKDRISLGRMIRIQGASNKDLIFYITKDDEKQIENENERPVVNGVGFWNLLKDPKDGEIRNIIHVNEDQAINIGFGFLMKRENNIQSIRVCLTCTRHLMNNETLTLWQYERNEDSSMNENESKSASSPSNVSRSPCSSSQESDNGSPLLSNQSFIHHAPNNNNNNNINNNNNNNNNTYHIGHDHNHGPNDISDPIQDLQFVDAPYLSEMLNTENAVGAVQRYQQQRTNTIIYQPPNSMSMPHYNYNYNNNNTDNNNNIGTYNNGDECYNGEYYQTNDHFTSQHSHHYDYSTSESMAPPNTQFEQNCNQLPQCNNHHCHDHIEPMKSSAQRPIPRMQYDDNNVNHTNYHHGHHADDNYSQSQSISDPAAMNVIPPNYSNLPSVGLPSVEPPSFFPQPFTPWNSSNLSTSFMSLPPPFDLESSPVVPFHGNCGSSVISTIYRPYRAASYSSQYSRYTPLLRPVECRSKKN